MDPCLKLMLLIKGQAGTVGTANFLRETSRHSRNRHLCVPGGFDGERVGVGKPWPSTSVERCAAENEVVVLNGRSDLPSNPERQAKRLGNDFDVDSDVLYSDDIIISACHVVQTFIISRYQQQPKQQKSPPSPPAATPN
jgi:hypothetical protein